MITILCLFNKNDIQCVAYWSGEKRLKLQTEAVQSDDKSGFGKCRWKRYQNLCHVRYVISFTTIYCGQLLCQFSHTFVGFRSRLSKRWASKEGCPINTNWVQSSKCKILLLSLYMQFHDCHTLNALHACKQNCLDIWHPLGCISQTNRTCRYQKI